MIEKAKRKPKGRDFHIDDEGNISDVKLHNLTHSDEKMWHGIFDTVYGKQHNINNKNRLKERSKKLKEKNT